MQKWAGLAALVLVFEAVGGMIGEITQSGIKGWYSVAAKSPLTPPDWVFGATWSFLYSLLAIALWHLLRHRQKAGVTGLLGLYGVQMALNIAWNPVFFNLEWLWASVGMIVVMIGLTVLIITAAKKRVEPVAWLHIPYLCWISFALYLSAYIAIHN